MIRRILGLFMIIIGSIGAIFAVTVFFTFPPKIDTVAISIDSTLISVSANLDTVEETLLLAKGTVSAMSTTFDTVETSMDQFGQAVNTTTPLLDQLSTVASSDVPESIEAMQTAIPDMAQVAGVIDETLTTLNRFKIEESFFGIDLNYSLGVDYAPTRPFDETVLALGDSLDGLPGSLRSLQVYTNVAQDNLQTVSQSLFEMGDDIVVLNGRIAEIDPLLDDYLKIVTETNDNTRLMRNQISNQWTQIKRFVRIAAFWFGLSQLAPLYLGWELINGYRTVVKR